MDDEWYWSLTENRAITADERGQAHEVLGPFPTKQAAENWEATYAARNERWDDDDREWQGDDDGE